MSLRFGFALNASSTSPVSTGSSIASHQRAGGGPGSVAAVSARTKAGAAIDFGATSGGPL